LFSPLLHKNVQKWNIQDYNFAYGSVWVQNFVSDIKGGLMVFEKRVLRRIFGPRRDEVIGGWRKLHNEDLHNLYSLPSIIKMVKSWKIRRDGHVEQMRKKRNTYRILV
jgi:hypothetical protein